MGKTSKQRASQNKALKKAVAARLRPEWSKREVGRYDRRTGGVRKQRK